LTFVPSAVTGETPWLEPMPDAWLELADEEPGPEARYEARESVELAFVATLQQLSGRQRAVLLLRDVLGYSAQDVAGMLDLSATATHSLLQRARASIVRPVGASARLTAQAERTLVDRYMRAWEQSDVDALVALLKRDARLSMPPLLEWYEGSDAIAGFFRWATGPDGRGPYRFVPTRANRGPAFAIYADGQPFILQAVEADEAGIGQIISFMNPALFEFFSLRSSVHPGRDDFVAAAPTDD
jgi:RNA polymerase sigma-70 factor (ECF subfamily)